VDESTAVGVSDSDSGAREMGAPAVFRCYSVLRTTWKGVKEGKITIHVKEKIETVTY